MFKCLNNLVIYIFKNISKKSKYSTKIIAFLINNEVIQAFLSRYINPRLKKAIYTTNILIFLFDAILINSFLSIILTYPVIDKTLAKV